MAHYQRPEKQKKQGPDEFISFFDHVVRYFLRHQGKLIGLGVTLVLAFGCYGLYLYYQGYRVREFASLYQQAQKDTGQKGLQVWEELLHKSPPLDLREIIHLQMGGIYSQELKWDSAAQQFGEAGQSRSQVLGPLGQFAHGVALENAGAYEKALVAFQNLSQEKDSPLKEFARLGMARCLLQMGKKQEAEPILMSMIGANSDVPAGVKSAALNTLLVLRLKSGT